MNVSLKKYQLQDQKNTANAFKETKIEISLIKEYIQFPPQKKGIGMYIQYRIQERTVLKMK